MRGKISSHKELLRKLEDMEMKYDEQFRVVFDANPSAYDSAGTSALSFSSPLAGEGR